MSKFREVELVFSFKLLANLSISAPNAEIANRMARDAIGDLLSVPEQTRLGYSEAWGEGAKLTGLGIEIDGNPDSAAPTTTNEGNDV